MKFILCFLVCCVMPIAIWGQLTKNQEDSLRMELERVAQQLRHKNIPDYSTTVAVIPFSTSFEYDQDTYDFPTMLAERVQTAVEQSKRFIMVDRLDIEKLLSIQLDQRKNEQRYNFWQNVSESHLIETGKMLGVEYIFTGNISNVATPYLISGGFGGEIAFTTKVISVETGKIFATTTCKGATEKLLGKNSKREAINAALDNSAKPVKEFLDKYFPARVFVKNLGELNRKGVPKELTIKGGLSQGFRDGQNLDIMQIKKSEILKENFDFTTIASSDSYSKIGEVKIAEIFAEQSNCKIIDGGKEILHKMSDDSDYILIAQSKGYKSNVFDRLD